ncbi:hypothetical protein M3O57_17170 [Xanthomonas nasturtii]|uniref:Uncharacterized protein n=1 Tax=Xanthomonas nasturtii TaxID=1843581 RepID=A0A3E1KSP2_9XANT|nr:hypothetical protein [Xanthomonas nasturtii]MCL1529750.1 hypothetical protein [Xanthomonas nasturtii]MCL1564631.1 hypothetical protein [Xanthomonas nasturtii]MCL1570734.1 hypothetical protein [Xanthomonas nasturtii]MCL1574503.1 hypothetical protein [Xanthomonas nasturtii]MCL1582320.1 hypothetical protein [Xanthomonas nasturtii]
MSSNKTATNNRTLDKCMALVREIECGSDIRIFAARNLFKDNERYDQNSFYAACRDELGGRATADGLCEAYPDSKDPLKDAYDTYLTLFKVYGVNWPELALAHYFEQVRKCQDPVAAAEHLWENVMRNWYKDLVLRAAHDHGHNVIEEMRFEQRDNDLASDMTARRIDQAAMSRHSAAA